MFYNNQNNNMNNTNYMLDKIFTLAEKGGNPNQIMQELFRQNPNLQNALTQFNNMSKGRNMQEFILQLARQSGVQQNNIDRIAKFFTNK